MINAYCDGGGDNVHQTYFYGSYVVGETGIIDRWNYTTIYPEIQTTNMAEYKTLVLLLKYILFQRMAYGLLKDPILIHSDSQLMVKQVNGEQKIYSPRLLPYYIEAIALMGRLENVKLEWVSRKVIVKILGH